MIPPLASPTQIVKLVAESWAFLVATLNSSIIFSAALREKTVRIALIALKTIPPRKFEIVIDERGRKSELKFKLHKFKKNAVH